MHNEPRILYLDLETLPDLGEVLKHFPRLSDWPGLTLKAQINSVLCFGYKWAGERTHVKSAWDYPRTWRKCVNDDKELVRFALEQLAQADIVVTFNGKRFDWKFLATRAAKHGLGPLPKVHHVDLCNESKRNLFLVSNRLGNVSDFLLGDKKLENGGWPLWVKSHKRDKKALAKMARYCAKDVDLLVPLFQKMRAHMKLPNYNHCKPFTIASVCPNCGSTRHRSDGLRIDGAGVYRRLQCRDCFTRYKGPAQGKLAKHL